MRKKVYSLIGMLVLGFGLLSNVSNTYAADSTTATTSTTPSISYSTNVQDIGWQSPVADGQVSGTTGQAKRLEAIKISVNSGGQDLHVNYTTHVQDIGWQNPVTDGQISGTTGQAKRLEAIKINLTGAQAANYDVYYRVHAETYGWMDWVKNGDMAGTTGQAKRLEAIQIVIVKKGSTPTSNNVATDTGTTPVVTGPSVTYRTSVQDYGWLDFVSDGQLSGRDDQEKRIEAVQIALKNAPYTGGITYKTHVQDIGWQNNVSDGATSGTIGQAKEAEAIQMSLTGEMANHYDVYYRVHSKDFGWLDWAKNGQSAGTQGLAKKLEALEIVLVAKGGAAPGPTVKPFLTKPSVTYASHVQDIGWQDFVADGALSGTQGQDKHMEAVKINLQNSPYSGDITYSTIVQDTGWVTDVSNGGISGTTGQNKRLEAIKINLSGEIANHYDVYYRVHVSDFGWLGWAKNGEPSGTENMAKQMEALEIVLVAKGAAAPGSTDRHYLTPPSITYAAHVQDIGWQGFVADGATSGTVGLGKRLEAIKIALQNSPISGGITYSAHVQDIGWMNYVSDGQIAGTVGQEKRIEAITMNLTGDIANYYDVYYRVHSEDFGWLGWAKNGMKAGTVGLGKRVEAIEIKLVLKNTGEAVSANAAFKQPFKVFLDPGHGGSDPGATAGGYRESDLNFAIAKKVQALLLNRGYTVYMSRTSDTFVSLLDRSQMANDDHADIFVSIHTNSSVDSTVSGIESYYYQYDPAYPSKINAGMDTNPDRIAKSV
ncbi:MAG: N-acetylmuramoyl-L-alanine amidase, partial [Bacillota bacterium]|nr:N-acetylmuramoyl-L-alanine amidase [Bacillota bacterium]